MHTGNPALECLVRIYVGLSLDVFARYAMTSTDIAVCRKSGPLLRKRGASRKYGASQKCGAKAKPPNLQILTRFFQTGSGKVIAKRVRVGRKMYCINGSNGTAANIGWFVSMLKDGAYSKSR
eukprot:2199235-Rhodomonas_salina.1